jgi:NADH dehydrogenase/NADH:ubiquinone oxidoreductase subunit G
MSKLKDRKKAKRVAAKEVIKAGLKKAGKKLLSGALGVGSALLNTQKAYAPNNMGKYVKQKDGSVRFVKTKFMDDDGKGGPLPTRKKAKMMAKKKKQKAKPIAKKKEVFERQEFPIKKGRFKGLGEAEYKKEIRRLRKMKAERDAALKKPKMQTRKKQEKVSVLKSQGLNTISVPQPDPTSRVGNKIGNVKVVRQSKNYGVKDLFQGSKGRKKIRETRKKRKRTFNPYD